jgi:hypothetical protein
VPERERVREGRAERPGVCVYAVCCEVCLMLLLASCCWNGDDDDMLGRVAWNAAYVWEVLKRMFLWW